MWRESRRRVMVVVVVLATAACTNAEADSTSTTSGTSTTPAVAITTTTVAPTTTTTGEAPTTTPSGLPTEAVGSPEALAVLIDEGIEFSALAYGEEVDRSIVPDLTALNVVMAAKAIFEFEARISALAPAARWVDVFSLPGSPAYSEYLRSFTALEENGLRAEIGGNGYEVKEVRIATEDEVSNPTLEALGDAPDGSLVLRITTSSGSIRFVNEDGEVSSSNDGWSNRSRLVIVAPSDSGWKLYWTESV